MGFDAFAEPLIVASILTFGVIWNRRKGESMLPWVLSPPAISPSSSPLLGGGFMTPQWKERKFFGKRVKSRSTARYSENRVSRFLKKFPFLIEVWYWLLVYWVYQLGRAFTAVTMREDTWDISRLHGLAVIAAEQRLGIFWELDVQAYFLARPTLLKVINCIYSFIHIPGTIFFLAWLYHYAPAKLFEARRRTLAVCNLMAFVVFTAWPCMPPRLLPEEDGFGFVDTVHQGKVASVWTTNKFCNQLAAMPSLHFGYSFVIGLTIATMPSTSALRTSLSRRILLIVIGMSYPLLILTAIVATANHYILDAVAGFFVSLIAWKINAILCNFLVLEDYFFYLVHVHKPSRADDETRSGASSPTEVWKDGDEQEWWRQA